MDTFKTPPVASRFDGIVAVICPDELVTDGTIVPLTITIELEMNPLPARLIWTGKVLTFAEFGLSDVSTGVGATTVKAPPDAVPPPGALFVTCSCNGPAWFKIAAGMVPASVVLLTNVVVIGVLSKRI